MAAATVKPPLQDLTAVGSCPVCAQKFGLTRKKYHCKFCGLVVCGACSRSRAEVQWAQTLKRICDSCKVGNTTVTSSEVLLQHLVSDWMARMQRGETDCTSNVLEQGHDLTGQQVLVRAMMQEFREHLCGLDVRGLCAAMAVAEDAVARMCEAQTRLFDQRGLDMDLHVLSRLCAVNLEMSSHLLASRESALSTVDAASGAGLADALMLSNVAKPLAAVHDAATDLIARIVMDDVNELLDHQLFQRRFEDMDGNRASWFDSDVTMCCVEATFDDFFRDIIEWLDNGKAAEAVVLACLRDFVVSYLERLLGGGAVQLDAEGKVAERVTADLGVLERCFWRYDSVGRPALSRCVQPLRHVTRLLGTPPEEVPGLVRGLQPLFGECSVMVCRGLLALRPDLPPEEERAIIQQLNALPASASEPVAGAIDLNITLRPPRRESVRTQGRQARAAASQAAAAVQAAQTEAQAAQDPAARAAAERKMEAAKQAERDAAGAVAVAEQSAERRQEYGQRKKQELREARRAAEERVAAMDAEVSRVESRLGVAQSRLDFLLDQPEPEEPEGVRKRNRDIAAARHQLVAAREAARLTAKKRESVVRHSDQQVAAIAAELPPGVPEDEGICVDTGFMQRFLTNFSFFGMCAGLMGEEEEEEEKRPTREVRGAKMPVGFPQSVPESSTGGSSGGSSA